MRMVEEKILGANWLLLQVMQRTECHNTERNKYIQHEIQYTITQSNMQKYSLDKSEH
jgi:hypothetical protein